MLRGAWAAPTGVNFFISTAANLNLMWTWSLNWNEVTPELVIGSCPMRPDDLTRIRQEAQVSAVLSLQHDDCLAYWQIDPGRLLRKAAELGLIVARCPIRDFDIVDMRRKLPRAIATLADLLAKGHRTYVHCTAGLGRSPLVVLAYLILVENRDPEEAIATILAARSGAVPAWEAYRGCRRDLAKSHRSAIEMRAYELYEQGVNKSADADWRQAESEVLRSLLLGGIFSRPTK